MMEQQQREAFAQRHPGWEAWQSIRGGQWHARLVGSQPVVMVHDDTIEELSRQVDALAPVAVAVPPGVPQEQADRLAGRAMDGHRPGCQRGRATGMRRRSLRAAGFAAAWALLVYAVLGCGNSQAITPAGPAVTTSQAVQAAPVRTPSPLDRCVAAVDQ